MLDIRANDEHFPISLDPETIRSAGMVVPLSGNDGCDIVDAGEVFAGSSDLQELEVGAHVIQLDREIFGLHLDFENLPQIAYCLVATERHERDFPFFAQAFDPKQNITILTIHRTTRVSTSRERLKAHQHDE